MKFSSNYLTRVCRLPPTRPLTNATPKWVLIQFLFAHVQGLGGDILGFGEL